MNKNTKFTNPMKVITGPDTRWSYANVWEPKSINGGAPKYSVSLIIPKSDTKTVSKVQAAIEAAYRDMDPYDMPEELSMLQSQDMGKIGFIQDLIRGVKKAVDAAKPQETAAETVKETVVVHNEGGSNVQALLKRGNMALEDGEWSKADEFFEQVLNQDAECGAAYLGKFLARVQCRSAKAYADAFVKKAKCAAPNGKNAEACDADTAFVEACVKKHAVPGILSEKEIRRTLDFGLWYCKISDYYAQASEEARAQLAADKDLMRAVKYASNEVKTITEGIRQTLDTLRRDGSSARKSNAPRSRQTTATS